MSDFKKFAQMVAKNFDQMSKGELYVVDFSQCFFGVKEVYAIDEFGHPAYDLGPIKGQTAEKDIFDFYLDSFPDGSNPIFRVRTVHDGSYDKSFIRKVGGVVTIKDGTWERRSIWDGLDDAPYPYNEVAAAMSNLVLSLPILGLFRSKEWNQGRESNKNLAPDGSVETFHHFLVSIDKRHQSSLPGETLSQHNSIVKVFRRGLKELKPEAIEMIRDLISEKQLYRGQEHSERVKEFVAAHNIYKGLKNPLERDAFEHYHASQHKAVAGFRNTVIGTLAIDLSNGEELEKSVKKFESRVAPSNYKRPKALITQRMVDDAVKTLRDLDMEHAVDRRLARASDMDISDVIFVDRNTGKDMLNRSGIQDLLSDDVKKAKVEIKGSQKISGDDFVVQILPKAQKVEVVVRNEHRGNFVTVTAPKHGDSGGLFSWPNDFGWAYNGGVADSDLRREVEARGGSVTGDFRFSHSWNHPGRRNSSLMDLHVFHPGNGKTFESRNDRYGVNRARVGWNHRKHSWTGGVQDVDYTDPAPAGYIPVENITYPDRGRMPNGVYNCAVHNWHERRPNEAGFKAEIEFDGEIYEYDYPARLVHHEWVHVAEVTLTDGKFSIEHKIPCASHTSQKIWGVDTNNLVTVKTIMHSPNHWGGNKIGNKHLFFILEDCLVEEPPRGIFNEFLNPKLTKHRKVFEVLGNRTKCEIEPDQLSGVGFSETQKAAIDMVVTDQEGKKKTYEVNFG